MAKGKIEISDPLDHALPYQKRWVLDNARWKFGLMARQVGKDFSAALEGVRDIIGCERHGLKTDWLIAAPSERQSLESLNKWREAMEAYQLPIAELQVERLAGAETLLKSSTIVFPNGSRVIAVPGRPDTVRGYSANVLLTEFAFFEDPDLTWRAILPSITNPMRGGPKKVRLITTPNGIGNRAHEIWVKNYQKPAARDAQQSDRDGRAPSTWSCHFVDIHSAVADGLPVNTEELRAALDDAEGWAQEFECEFLDAQSVLLPYELIASCESEEATVSAPGDFWQRNARNAPPLFMGLDFGRKQDLTVCWTLERVGDVARTVEVLELSNMSTPEQVALLRPRLERARRVCLDCTGPGIGMGDYLVKEFQEWKPTEHKYGKIELCTFSAGLKAELFSKVRMGFERRLLRVPISRTVREDLHSVNRVVSESGGIGYRAARGAGGHADRCTALALALRAGEQEAPAPGNIYLFPELDQRRNEPLF